MTYLRTYLLHALPDCSIGDARVARLELLEESPAGDVVVVS